MLRRDQKLAIYMEGAVRQHGGKMGFGILRYSSNPISCVIDSETAGSTVPEIMGIPRKCPIVGSVEEAIALGADVFVLGIAPPGGLIPQAWFPEIDKAIQSGLSVVNGLHDLLGPKYPQIDGVNGQYIWDIRLEPQGLKPGTGAAAELSCKRLLLIGTDMAVGKMTAGLEIYRLAKERQVPTEFIATGQIGITITGAGIPLDAIRVDFASGAIEREVLRAHTAGAELVIVEGQGSLIHPGSTANLPLLRGSCPTHLILCHRATQTQLTYLPIPIPPLDRFIKMYEDLAEACGTFARPKTVAVALNTALLESEAEALDACKKVEDQLGIPCCDPIRHGAERLVEATLTTP